MLNGNWIDMDGYGLDEYGVDMGLIWVDIGGYLLLSMIVIWIICNNFNMTELSVFLRHAKRSNQK